MTRISRPAWAGWCGTVVIHGLVIGLLVWINAMRPAPPPIEQETLLDLTDVNPPQPKAPPPPPPVPPPVTSAAVPLPAPPTTPVAPSPSTTTTQAQEPDFLPQFKIEQPPQFPDQLILSQMVYPALAAKQGLEGTVILELSIDAEGVIRRIVVLKDPGFGFAEAAVTALRGVRVKPAQAGGQAVAVRYRYPIRFTLK